MPEVGAEQRARYGDQRTGGAGGGGGGPAHPNGARRQRACRKTVFQRPASKRDAADRRATDINFPPQRAGPEAKRTPQEVTRQPSSWNHAASFMRPASSRYRRSRKRARGLLSRWPGRLARPTGNCADVRPRAQTVELRDCWGYQTAPCAVSKTARERSFV